MSKVECPKSSRLGGLWTVDFGLWTLLSEALSNLFSAKGADAVEPETEQRALFLSHADVVGVVLRRHRATIPTVTNRRRRTNQRTVSLPRARLVVEEERRAAKQSALAVAQEDRRAPLRAAQRARFLAAGVGKSSQTRHQIDGARVVESLKRLHQRSIDSKRS